MLEAYLQSQPKPQEYRQDVLDALQDPFCTYGSIARELIVDGAPDTITEETIRKWWRKQPEYAT